MKVIAEIANTHEGDISYFFEHINELVVSGIKNIKVQYIVPIELGNPDSASFKEFSRLEIKENEYLELLSRFKSTNFFFDVFGNQSLDSVINLSKKYTNIKGIKFHTTNSMNFDLIIEASKFFNVIFISIGGLTAVEISVLIDFIEENSLKDQIVLSYGFQLYPSSISDVKINKLPELKKLFGMKICLSEHINGDLKIAKDIISYAFMMEYDYIEKHTSLDRSRKMDDDHSAITPNELKESLDDLNKLKEIKVENILKITSEELKYRNKSKSVIFLNKNIKKGEIVTSDLIRFARTDDDKEYYLNFSDAVGRPSSRALNKNEELQPKDLKFSSAGLIFVRNNSHRFPKKSLFKIFDKENIYLLIERLKKSIVKEDIFICTTQDVSDDIFVDIAKESGINIFRGDDSIKKRINSFLSKFNYDNFLRLTADNILIDPEHINVSLKRFDEGFYDYYKHEYVIDGCDFEIIRKNAYFSLSKYFNLGDEDSEYLTLFLKNSFLRTMRPIDFKAYSNFDYRNYRLTLDYEEDLENIKKVFSSFQKAIFSYDELVENLQKNKIDYHSFDPEVKSVKINKKVSF